MARSEEGPDRERLVEDRREEKERREFVEVETSFLIDSVRHFGCKKLRGTREIEKDSKQKIGPLLNRPERELFSCLKAGVFGVNEIKPTVVTGAEQRLAGAKNKGVERASIFRERNPDNDMKVVALSIDGNNFCGNGGQ